MRPELGAIVLGGILRAAVGMMDAAGRRLPAHDRRSERGQRQAGIDAAADAIADHAARPSIEYGRQIDEADGYGDIGDVGDPELAGRHSILGQVREDRPVVVAVGGRHKTPARTHG